MKTRTPEVPAAFVLNSRPILEGVLDSLLSRIKRDDLGLKVWFHLHSPVPTMTSKKPPKPRGLFMQTHTLANFAGLINWAY